VDLLTGAENSAQFWSSIDQQDVAALTRLRHENLDRDAHTPKKNVSSSHTLGMIVRAGKHATCLPA